MLAGKRPEELVMPVRQRLVAGPAIAGAVQHQRALIDNGAVAGRRPRLDLPGHGLAGVKSEGVKIEDANMRLVTPVGHRGGGIVDLHGAVVTVHHGRGLTVTRRSRHRPRARAGRPERKGDAGSDQRRTGNEGEISTPGNKGHSMPPLLQKPGLYQDKRQGSGNCYTPPPTPTAPRRPPRAGRRHSWPRAGPSCPRGRTRPRPEAGLRTARWRAFQAVPGERRGDLVGAESGPGSGRSWRAAVQRVQVRSRRPGQPCRTAPDHPIVRAERNPFGRAWTSRRRMAGGPLDRGQRLLPRLSTFPHPCSSTAAQWMTSVFT
jgi:hypothetical protein